ncbi:hypothetical protein VE02_02020 [Pseudogymnoascus sp. 03VT05]|nr:hypothetical protein VE02_02020 [Pseudogymnoascus sp. 03VT05]
MPVIGEVLEGDLKKVQVRKDLRDTLSAYDLGSAPSSEDEILLPVNLAQGYESPGEVVCVHADDSSRARPFFRFCVVSGALQGGACGSCVLKHNAAGCSFSTMKTWRPATPPPPPSPKAGGRAGTCAHAAQMAREAAAAAAENPVVVE